MPHKTYSAKAGDIKHAWHLVDVSDLILGRAASQIASILKGKHKPTYTPSIDTGDNVVVINAAKVRVTGNKAEQKQYYRHSLAGFPGGLKVTNFTKLQGSKPEEIIKYAVGRMLPRSALGRQMMTKLKVYPGAEHPHAAQSPVALKLKD
jgi:large subunit ribosomal protein L13